MDLCNKIKTKLIGLQNWNIT